MFIQIWQMVILSTESRHLFSITYAMKAGTDQIWKNDWSENGISRIC